MATYTKPYTLVVTGPKTSQNTVLVAVRDKVDPNVDDVYTNLNTIDTQVAGKAATTHTHGAGGTVYSIVADITVLGTGATDGEVKICADDGNSYSWEATGTKWRVRDGNKYTTAGLPVSATYNIATNTRVVDTTLGVWKQYNGSAWVIEYEPKATDIASAGTVDLTTSTGRLVHITGTTGITAITLASGYVRDIVFDGILTITHHATTLILPGGANITTAAGDRATFRGDGSGNTRCIHYTRANGFPLFGVATQTLMEAAADNLTMTTPATINWHPGAAKAWIKCDNAGAIQASHNITSITDTGTGVVTVTIATDFSSINYCISGCTSGYTITIGSTPAAGSFVANCKDYGGVAAEADYYFIACFGDQ